MRGILFSTLAVALASGCATPKKAAAPEAVAKARCQPEACAERGGSCQNDRCVECVNDEGCAERDGPGAYCEDGACRLLVECKTDDDCGPGRTCDVRVCRELEGEVAAAAMMAADKPVLCQSESDCPAGSPCVNNLCQKPATSDIETVAAKVETPLPPEPSPPVEEERVAGRFACGDPSLVVLFERGRVRINPEALAELKAAASCRGASATAFTIDGHADRTGGDDLNIRLSRKRALEVARRLKRAGVKKKQIRIRAKGESEPACDDDTRDCHSRNRRVRVRLDRRD